MNAESWNQMYQEQETPSLVPEPLLEELLKDFPVGTALDLGCGAGGNAIWLARQGWQVTAVDWAEVAIHQAREAATKEALPIEFVTGDITTLRLPQGFDLVLSTYALPGGKATRQTLQTAYAHLKPDGRLVVLEWDARTSVHWGFVEEDQITPERIAQALPGLELQRSECRYLKEAFPQEVAEQMGQQDAYVAIVVATKPKSMEGVLSDAL